MPQRRPADYEYAPNPDLAEDVRTVQARLEAAGLEVLVLDQTRPDIGLPVVKVVVPGMRGFWARFAPGRLYEVPVRLGRLATPHPLRAAQPAAAVLLIPRCPQALEGHGRAADGGVRRAGR